jgi:hypothetical protein
VSYYRGRFFPENKDLPNSRARWAGRRESSGLERLKKSTASPMADHGDADAIPTRPTRNKIPGFKRGRRKESRMLIVWRKILSFCREESTTVFKKPAQQRKTLCSLW